MEEVKLEQVQNPLSISDEEIDKLETLTKKKEHKEDEITVEEGDEIILSTKNLPLFRTLLNCMKGINVEGEIEFQDNCLFIKSIDESKTYMINIKIFDTVLDVMTKPKVPIIINWDDLYSLIKAENNKSMSLILTQDNQLLVHIKGKLLKRANIELLDCLEDNAPDIPITDYPLTTKIDSNIVDEVITHSRKMSKKDSPYIIFKVHNSMLALRAEKDNKWFEVDIKKVGNVDDLRTKYNGDFVNAFMPLKSSVENFEYSMGIGKTKAGELAPLPLKIKIVKEDEFIATGAIAPLIDNK